MTRMFLLGMLLIANSAQAQFMPYLPPPMPPMQVQPLPSLPPPVVYPQVPTGPRACETICRPLRDGGTRCTNVCY